MQVGRDRPAEAHVIGESDACRKTPTPLSPKRPDEGAFSARRQQRQHGAVV